jgi:hypothetical protein
MFLAHSFRLRDPWQCECREAGALCWSRVFHLPTGLEHDDALWLVCSLLPPGAVVTVNGQRMTPCADGVPPVPSPAARNEFDLTALLSDTNRIEIQIPSDLQPTAYGLQPTPPSDLQPPAGPAVAVATSSLQPSPFPYDIRLGIVGHS